MVWSVEITLNIRLFPTMKVSSVITRDLAGPQDLCTSSLSLLLFAVMNNSLRQTYKICPIIKIGIVAIIFSK